MNKLTARKPPETEFIMFIKGKYIQINLLRIICRFFLFSFLNVLFLNIFRISPGLPNVTDKEYEYNII